MAAADGPSERQEALALGPPSLAWASSPGPAEEPPALPEDAARVAAWDAALDAHAPLVLERSRALRERLRAARVTTLDGVGWPLRPLFIPREHLAFYARAIHRALDAARARLLERAGDPAFLAAHAPIEPRMFEALDLAGALASEDLLAVLRPDGFLWPGRFVLTEVNFGNGTLVSNTYAEVLAEHFATSGLLDALGWDARGLDRPFPALTALLRRRAAASGAPREGGRPLVALLAHHWEHAVIKSWHERVIQQIDSARERWRAVGIDTEVVFEDGLAPGGPGERPRLRADGREVDLVHLITIGTSFMDEPARLAPGGDLAHLRGARVGAAPLVKPLASLLFDKGTMPFLAELPIWPQEGPLGARLELAETGFPDPAEASRLRLERARLVLKRAFDGKDTLVGPSAKARRWNRVLEGALGRRDYVVQRYLPLPRATLPISRDGRTIERIPVRVELSPFVIDGAYAGAIARYAPDADGLILSPPPPDMGMTLVYAT